jgi:hypothetical protein
VIATLLSRVWLRVKFLLLALAVLFYSVLFTGYWLAGIPLGIVLSILLMRHVARQTETPRLPSTMASAGACYAFSAVPGFLVLFCVAAIQDVTKHGPPYEVTAVGVALGFFLHPTYKLLRWGRTFQLEAQRAG